MSIYILDSFPFQFIREALHEELRIRPDTGRAEEFDEFLLQAQATARPKVIYRVAFINDKGTDHVDLDGIQLKSKVLRVNLDTVHRVFPYVVTCGNELEAWQGATEDVLHRFWIDAIKELGFIGGTISGISFSVFDFQGFCRSKVQDQQKAV